MIAGDLPARPVTPAAVKRMIDACARHLAAGDPDALVEFAALHEALDEALAAAVLGVKEHATWEEIGEAFGMTRQSAHGRWSPPRARAAA